MVSFFIVKCVVYDLNSNGSKVLQKSHINLLDLLKKTLNYSDQAVCRHSLRPSVGCGINVTLFIAVLSTSSVLFKRNYLEHVAADNKIVIRNLV